MRISRRIARPRGFTLVELMVGIGVMVILLAIAAPSFQQLVAQQRLKSINAELVTSIQFARSEAVARNKAVQMQFQTSPGSMTCYMVLIQGGVTDCDCTRPPGSACTAGLGIELHSTQVPASTDVQVLVVPGSPAPVDYTITSDGVLLSGGPSFVIQTNRISAAAGCLQTTVNVMGRPTVASC